MTRVKGRHLSVATAEEVSEDDGVEIRIVNSFSPCHSPASPSPTQQQSMVSPPISPTRQAFRKIFESIEHEEATRQSPPESPTTDNVRDANISLERQSPSLTNSSSRSNESTSQRASHSKQAEEAARPIHRKTPALASEFSSSSSTSDIMNTETRFDRYDISPQISERLIDASDDGETISPVDNILAEARSFVASNASTSSRVSSPTKTSDQRKEDIIQQARSQVGKERARMRTTEEVLQLAGEVLSSRSKSPGVSPQTSRDSVSPTKQSKEAHVSLRVPSLDNSGADWDPPMKVSTPSMSSRSMADEEIADHMNSIRKTPLHDVLSSDSLAMTRMSPGSSPEKPVTKEGTESPRSSLLGFLKKENECASPGSTEKRSVKSLSAAFGCNSHAVENVISIDEEEEQQEEQVSALQLNFMLQQRFSNFNPFASWRGNSILSADADDNDAKSLSEVSSMLQSASPFYPLSEGLQANEVDPRMPIWMTEHGAEVMESTSAPEDTFYSIGPSRAIIVHEIVRGNWTWCTAWSPDGGRLALATENHHLAVVETTASTVWRVRHDQRLSGPVKNGTTHSIRSIAWGQNFIAIGGTGNAVSILAPIEPYPVLHTILDTGFVGSLCWRRNSTVLAIGNRDDKCLVVNVSADDGDGGRHIQSNILETITRPDWVNSVAFSPGGTALAVGDRSGTLALYNYERKMPTDPPTISFLREFLMEDSVLSVEWSANGKWLYAGGEEFSVSVIDTTTWTVVREIPRKKWVHFISSSNRGTHVAVGGVASEVSIFDAENDWEEAISIELKGMVPLSASWHPQDQYLALTGQNNSVIAVETTNARHVHGHCLHSISPVLEVEFSPDGQMIVIGNEAGVVSFFCLEGFVFVTTYEMVLTSGESQSIRWSRDGQYVVIGTGDQVIIVSKISDQKMEKMPPGASGFSVRKVIRGLGKVRSISIDDTCRYVAVGGTTTRILDAADQFSSVREWKKRIVQCNAFSPDGTWLASIGRNENLTIYNTSAFRVDKWRVVFTLKAERAGLALAWGPAAVKGLQYLAYGGANSMITILEIRTKEETWETVLEIPRAGVIHDLDWSNTGMLAAAIGDGTVTIIDLEYLQSGWAMNEMDYTWQRQGITCLTEIRRNKGKNSMRTVRWIPSLDQSLIAIGGTDGSLEIVDLTERKRCGGFLKATSQRHMAVN